MTYSPNVYVPAHQYLSLFLEAQVWGDSNTIKKRRQRWFTKGWLNRTVQSVMHTVVYRNEEVGSTAQSCGAEAAGSNKHLLANCMLKKAAPKLSQMR